MKTDRSRTLLLGLVAAGVLLVGPGAGSAMAKGTLAEFQNSSSKFVAEWQNSYSHKEVEYAVGHRSKINEWLRSSEGLRNEFLSRHGS